MLEVRFLLLKSPYCIALLCFAWSCSVGTVFTWGKSALNKLLPFSKVSLSKKKGKDSFKTPFIFS